MTTAVPLDTLITFVKDTDPSSSALEHLTRAVAVAGELNEQADALVGHFVDQARRSGASWTDIGASMGVTRQAAQKRFVPRWDGSDPVPATRAYTRYTARSRDALLAADAIARTSGREVISVRDLLGGLLTQREGVAGLVIARSVEPNAVATFFGLPSAVDIPAGGSSQDLESLRTDAATKRALEDTVKAALRLGHNYIGTEHLLLGLLAGDSEPARHLAEQGVTAELTEDRITSMLDGIRRARRG